MFENVYTLIQDRVLLVAVLWKNRPFFLYFEIRIGTREEHKDVVYW